MIIILDSKNEDDEYRIQMLNEGSNYFSVVVRMQEYIRDLDKYSQDIDINIEKLYEKWVEILQDNKVDPY